MESTPPTILYLIRHGETDANLHGIWNGATDSPLNERGVAQAQAVARRLQDEAHDLAAIYTSPLLRARQTTQSIVARLHLHPIHVWPELAEFNLGAWEGLSYETLQYEKKLWDRMKADPFFAPPGGESAAQFAMRLVTAIRSIAQQHPAQRVVVVSHGGAMATVLAMLVEQDGQNWRAYQMANCSLSELAFQPEPRLLRLNDTSHLDAVGKLDDWR
ncbi:MAG: histidine phosphatase family protein [Chloroflexi bacterium]|nr:histidine phosphatase family protein [Chloroflexota bacterium]